MPEFTCRVGTPVGEVREETHVARDEQTLRQELERRDLHVFEITARRRGIQVGRFRLGGGAQRVPRRQFLLFNQEMVALIKAGLPLLQCLDVILERMRPGPFRRYLTDIRDRVQSGSALSEAFLAQGEAFPRMYAASLTAGERSGELASVMSRYLQFARKTEAIRTKVVSALIYPALLSFLSAALIALLMFYILPKFATFYSEFDTEMPALTTFVVSLAKWLQANIVLAALVLIGGPIAARVWYETDAGRFFFDNLKLRLPVVGHVGRMYNTAQFSRTLSTLLSGGIPLVSALQTVVGAMSNRVFTQAVTRVTEDVRQGHALAESIDRTGIMSDLTIDMVQVGESTGSLDVMLAGVADFYDEQVDETMTRIVSLFEPILLVVMGFVVALVLLAMYLPIFKVAGATV